MLDPSSRIQLDLHVVLVVDGFMTHTESNGCGAEAQQLPWHLFIEYRVSIQEQKLTAHDGSRKPAARQIIRNFEEGIEDGIDARAVGVAPAQQRFNRNGLKAGNDGEMLDPYREQGIDLPFYNGLA